MNKIVKIILLSIILATFGALAIYVAMINRPEPATIPPATADEIVEEPATTPGDAADYSEFYDQIIPANADNGNIGDHVRGNTQSKVTIIEYADLQCPGCATLMMYMSSLYKKNSDRATFIFRHFPLTMHPNAGVAAVAAESAGLQGYFWEMVETLYSNQGSWANKTGDDLKNYFISTFKKIAPNGDVDKFSTNLENSDLIAKATFDRNLGRTYHDVHATPAVFINGKEYSVTDYKSYGDFAKAIQAEIDRITSK